MNFAALVNQLFLIYNYILLARVLMSWFPNIDRTHPVAIFLFRCTEPLLHPIRQAIGASMGGVDFSPLLAFFLLRLIRVVIIG